MKSARAANLYARAHKELQMLLVPTKVGTATEATQALKRAAIALLKPPWHPSCEGINSCIVSDVVVPKFLP